MTCLDPAPAPTLTVGDSDDDAVNHIYCGCTPDISPYGEPLEVDDDPDSDIEAACVVCVDLEASPCERCGTP